MKIAKSCVCCGSNKLSTNQAVLAPFIAARVFGWYPAEITVEWGLRDVKLGTTYSACNSLSCEVCGFVFLDMRFDDEEMGRLYDDYRGDSYSAQRDRFEPGYWEKNKKLVEQDVHIPQVEAFLRSRVPLVPRILDWGGATGLNTPFRQSASLHHICDISNRPTVPGAVMVTPGDAMKNEYDLVVCSNVLEHVPDPKGFLEEVTVIAGKRPLYYIEVPFEQLMYDKATKTSSNAIKRIWHEHINFYSETGLRALFERAGLKIVEHTVIEYDRPERLWRAFAIAATVCA